MVDMGNPSNLEIQEVKITDPKGLDLFLTAHPDFLEKSCLSINGDQLVFLDGNEFMGWDDAKIIEYWYKETMEIFEAINPYVKGRLVFHSIDWEEQAVVLFTGNKRSLATIHTQLNVPEPENLGNLEEGLWAKATTRQMKKQEAAMEARIANRNGY